MIDQKAVKGVKAACSRHAALKCKHRRSLVGILISFLNCTVPLLLHGIIALPLLCSHPQLLFNLLQCSWGLDQMDLLLQLQLV